MSQSIKNTLEKFAPDGKHLSLPATAFQGPIETVIEQFLDGSQLNIDAINGLIKVEGNEVIVTGTGAGKPLTHTTVTAVFSPAKGGVELKLDAEMQPDWSFSSAWPVLLDEPPFSELSVSQGSLELDAKFGQGDYDLTGSLTVAYKKNSLGTGYLKVTYAEEKLGFLVGVMLTGKWSPGSLWSPLKALVFSKTGIFVSTIKATDLQLDGKPLTFPPEIDPGFTLVSSLALEKDIVILADLFPKDTTLNLLANVPIDDPKKSTLQAELREHLPIGAFTFEGFDLDWEVEDQITLSAKGQLAVKDEKLDLDGEGTLNYGGTTTSASFGLYIEHWQHPFGIPNLIIDSFGFDVTVEAEGLTIALGGQFEIGEGSDRVQVTVIGAVTDFELPDGLVFEIKSAEDKNKAVTLPALINDFIPALHLDSVPLLKDISFKDIKVLAVAAPFEYEDHTYSPGVGATGDIIFFGWELDFGFSLSQSNVQASGNLSKPIALPSGAPIFSLSDTTGKKGPSGSIDTAGSPYFSLDGKIALLGIEQESVKVEASKDSFEFDLDFKFFDVADLKLDCDVEPSKGVFNGAIDFGFDLSNLTIGPLEIDGVTIIPQIHINGPAAHLHLAVQTSPSPGLSFALSFKYLSIDFDLDFSLDVGEIENALKDFGEFLWNWIKEHAKEIVDKVFTEAEHLAEFLYHLGLKFWDIVKALVKKFVMSVEEAVEVVKNFFGKCAIETAQVLTHAV